MNVEDIREYCLSKRETTEGFPFDDTTLVFKVAGKMFALLNLKSPHSINLKCDPDKAIDLRERYSSVRPGYHMNKSQWNTILLDGSIDESLLKEWIDESYVLIIEKMPKYKRESLLNQ